MVITISGLLSMNLDTPFMNWIIFPGRHKLLKVIQEVIENSVEQQYVQQVVNDLLIQKSPDLRHIQDQGSD